MLLSLLVASTVLHQSTADDDDDGKKEKHSLRFTNVNTLEDCDSKCNRMTFCVNTDYDADQKICFIWLDPGRKPEDDEDDDDDDDCSGSGSGGFFFDDDDCSGSGSGDFFDGGF